MSYSYKNINPSTIQQPMQVPNIYSTTQQMLSIEQIAELKVKSIKLYHILEYKTVMGQYQDKQDNYNDVMYRITKICSLYKKICIVPHNQYLQSYLSVNREFKQTIHVYIDNSSKQLNIQEFFFNYRQISRLYNLPLVLWCDDLYILYLKQDFNILIDQLIKSSKYIQSVVLNDISSQNETVAPFDGQLFSLLHLHQSIKLFYYLVKQNSTFILNFNDTADLFQNLIIQYKSLKMDLLPRNHDIFNLILSSQYQNLDIIRIIKSPDNMQLTKEDFDKLNQFKTQQALMMFLSNKVNQNSKQSMFIYDKAWFESNVPNEIIRYLIAIQIPAIERYSLSILGSPIKSSDFYIILLFKHTIPIDRLVRYYRQGFSYLQRVLIEHQEELYPIEKISFCLEYIQDLLFKQGNLKISLEPTGQLVRQFDRNISVIEFITYISDLELIRSFLIQKQLQNITFIEVKHKLVVKILIKNIYILVVFHQYNENNKGVIQLRTSSTTSFWESFCKYLKKQMIIILNNQAIQDNKPIVVETEKQLFQLAKIKFIKPENRISYQIADMYIIKGK